MIGDHQGLIFLILILPFVSSLIAIPLFRALGARAAIVLSIVPAFAFFVLASCLKTVAGGTAITGGYAWIPTLGVDFSWYIDGLSLTFGLLISGIGFFIALYAGAYLKGHARQGSFFAFLMLFMGAMQGLVLADSLLTLFVFWELTSIASFLLIGFDRERAASRRAALQALLVTGLGGLALLAGVVLMNQVTAASSLSELLTQGDLMRGSPFYGLALVFILGAAFTKSAQFPFHFWLANAMEAPTPVSAYLHSATMVKAGVYLLMRLNPVLGGTAAWETALPLVGGATLVVGAILALRQTDLKQMLAYTTVASLGLLVMLTGIGTETAIKAAVLYLIAHALFKGAFFMIAGVIDHGTGTRDITQLGGLRGTMPVTFAAALLCALSMGGLPLFLGFMAKEEIYAALWQGPPIGLILLVIAILCNAAMFAIAFSIALRPFTGKMTLEGHEGSVGLLAGPAVLAIGGLALALWSGGLHHFLSSPMASAIVGTPVDVVISASPHLGMPLLLSAITVGLGILAYVALAPLRAVTARLLAAIGWGPDHGFDQVIRGIIKLSALVSRTIQNGRLDFYLKVTLIALAVSLLSPLFLFGEGPSWPSQPHMTYFEWAVIGIAVIGLVAVLFARDRLVAIACLGIQGFAIALLFMLFGAPDLSFTQFMVETLSVVILALVMTRLDLVPSDRRPVGRMLVDGTIAILAASGLGLLLLRVTQVPFDASLSEFYAHYSRLVAHGRNVVNVIIVDFRGLDTLGEIAVVMVTGLAILALLRIRSENSSDSNSENEKGI